jgi:hypothetical protein
MVRRAGHLRRSGPHVTNCERRYAGRRWSGSRAGETIFWLPELRTLVPGDRVLGGRDGGLRFCPESWLEYLPGPVTHADLKGMMQPLRGLDVERVLVSHGEPVLSDGARALNALLGGA